jgi:hypothetical protein
LISRASSATIGSPSSAKTPTPDVPILTRTTKRVPDTASPEVATNTNGRARPPREKANPSAAKADAGNDGDDPVPSDTAAAVAYWRRRNPNMHPAEIAACIDRSERTVRRYWPPTTTTDARRTHGHAADT